MQKMGRSMNIGCTFEEDNGQNRQGKLVEQPCSDSGQRKMPWTVVHSNFLSWTQTLPL